MLSWAVWFKFLLDKVIANTCLFIVTSFSKQSASWKVLEICEMCALSTDSPKTYSVNKFMYTGSNSYIFDWGGGKKRKRPNFPFLLHQPSKMETLHERMLGLFRLCTLVAAARASTAEGGEGTEKTQFPFSVASAFQNGKTTWKVVGSFPLFPPSPTDKFIIPPLADMLSWAVWLKFLPNEVIANTCLFILTSFSKQSASWKVLGLCELCALYWLAKDVSCE